MRLPVEGSNVAPLGRPEAERAIVSLKSVSVAFTVKEMVEPSAVTWEPGTDNPGGRLGSGVKIARRVWFVSIWTIIGLERLFEVSDCQWSKM